MAKQEETKPKWLKYFSSGFAINLSKVVAVQKVQEMGGDFFVVKFDDKGQNMLRLSGEQAKEAEEFFLRV